VSQPIQSGRRRFFMTADADHDQLLSFDQNRNDGSIYVSSPAFSTLKWLTLMAPTAVAAPVLAISDVPNSVKLSLHGSGLSHVRSSDPVVPTVAVQGNCLKNDSAETLGVRHLFTMLPTEPTHLPSSPAFNRASDYGIRVERMVPYVVVFWAVPAVKKLSVKVAASFHVNDLESVPPESGWGSFGLALHAVVWFAYRTRHLLRWPQVTHIAFHDGFLVPLLIGTAEGTCRVEYRPPSYQLTETSLMIGI
jgi:hypothetical protein